jgi:predicted DNA-binding transcriptional regulator AlpA
MASGRHPNKIIQAARSTDATPGRGRVTMTEHPFTLTIRGALTDARLDALFEAGCDDATFSTKGELTFGEFDRDAPSLLDAVLSAIVAVESVDDGPFGEVLHVDPDELVWASEIAERTGRSRQSIDMLIRGQRGPGNFPAPVSHATRNPLWRWSEVEAWFAVYEGRPVDRERSAVLGALNGALQVRHGLRSSTQIAHLRRAVRQLLAS